LELYKNSSEINKNQYYSHFLKKKNKNFISGRFSSGSLSSAQPTRGPPALARVARSRGAADVRGPAS
jgi:hypothetical protein